MQVQLKTTSYERLRALTILLAPIGVLGICGLLFFVGIPLMFAWPDIKHQLTLDGLKEFQCSTGYSLAPDARLIYCEDSRGGWHGDGTLNLHLNTTSAEINNWTSESFKGSEWHKGFRNPDFDSNRAQGPTRSESCFWAKWGDSGNWRLIIVQPDSGNVWYTESNS
ncbi:MAG: hypothetical protein AAF483_27535 [Planctomycetota bacterium]